MGSSVDGDDRPLPSLLTGSSIASFLRDGIPRPIQEGLDYFQLDFDFKELPSNASPDLRLLHDLVSRIVHRGLGTLPSIEVERLVASVFGGNFGLEEQQDELGGGVTWQLKPQLLTIAEQFSNYLSPWTGDPDSIPVDPSSPHNERRHLTQLRDHFGPKLVSCLYTQVHLSDLLPDKNRQDFLGQRLDFLVAFPNGRSFVLEPGDHELGSTPGAQKARDMARDKALLEVGIPTLRFANARIGTSELMADIEVLVQKAGGHPFLAEKKEEARSKIGLRLSHLCLLPTTVARLEHVFATVFLQRGLLSQESFSLCVVEQDLECAEIAMYGFLERLQRLATLYRIELALPSMQLVVMRSGSHSCADLSGVRDLLAAFGCAVTVVKELPTTTFDLSVDVAIKSNYLTASTPVNSIGRAKVRNTFSHSHKFRFSYSAQPRRIELSDKDQPLLETFLADFFRKQRFREGQFPIIQNVMAQTATIGLLPTGAGKSICFQLASLLTPGITLVVDPITFLMKDQVLGLTVDYGITTVAAWHSEAGLYRDEQIGELMATNLMIFLSPERFLRPSFRSAMANLRAGDLFVNYAVIDEAHCVSMWGHDFRPPYLMLERCFREFCTFGGREPVVVALTGTASQLVLIDLKRQLGIEGMESIIRPNTFDRPELTFNIVASPANGKQRSLSDVLRGVARRHGVQDVMREATGMVFAHTPKQVWELYGAMAGDADSHVAQIAAAGEITQEMACGMASGGKAKNSTVTAKQWKRYKDMILPHFKSGKVRMLIGNAAIGVGIDNEHVNYVVVYCMPGSLESLGQQWGRAGRRGQDSQCYLIYSDDMQAQTDQWLNGELAQMPRRFDDLGTISWFHSSAFPGEKEDSDGTLKIMGQIFRTAPDGDGRRAIGEDYDERVQRYLSFLIMLGLVEDYEVTGIGANTKYRVALLPNIERDARASDNRGIQASLVSSLQAYLSRYRPTTERDILDGLEGRPEGKLSQKAVGYLINFIYSGIAYQRKESIRTIVGFCRETDQSPEVVRTRMKAFFDRNPKFSDRLDEMASEEVSIDAVMIIIDLIEGYDDAEHLFWETRRLLDERFRADWAALNLYAIIYREKAISRNAQVTFEQLLTEIEQRLSAELGVKLLVEFFNGVNALDETLNASVSDIVMPPLFEMLYKRTQVLCLEVLDGVACNEDVKLQLRGLIAVFQMEGLLNVVKLKHGLG
jgi:ATP-dependent DNA helicase RecQ